MLIKTLSQMVQPTFRVSNYPRTALKALSLHDLEERRCHPGGPSHDRHPTEAQAKEGRQTKALGDYLGSARPPLGADLAHPPGFLAAQTHRPPPRRLVTGAQRHHLPPAFQLPVGEAAA